VQDEEEELLRSVAIQNARSILAARQRAERKSIDARLALERTTQAQRATLQATWDAILVTDQHGTVTDFNHRFVLLWGVPENVLRTLDHRSIIAYTERQFADPALFRARVEQIYAGSPQESLDTLELADGRVFERYTTPQVIDGKNVGRVWSFRDITAHRQAERLLRDETRILEVLNRTGSTLSSQLDVQSVLQAVTDAATELSRATFGAFLRTDTGASAGPTLGAVAGIRREEFERVVLPSVAALCEPALRGARASHRDDLAAGGRTRRLGDGGPPGPPSIRSHLAAPVVSRSGAVVGVVFLGHTESGAFTERDDRLVTGIAAQAAIAIDNANLFEQVQRAAEDRRQLLESERVARADAERANAMKDEFLATLSHELRTPLGAILGWSHILRARSALDTELRRGLDVIERNARIQAQLIEDLLDMARITSGKLRLLTQPTRPVAVIEAAIETVRPSAEAKGVQLTKLLDATAGPITGDPSRLQQVVWNLLSNAIKFTGRDGRIEVRLTRSPAYVEIVVADSGIGIAPEFLPYVFDRFRQQNASESRTAGGLGLGLALVRHLVELHGGSVRAESEGEGRGATFTIRLPYGGLRRSSRAAERVDDNAPDFRQPNLSGVKVLIVDDHDEGRELIARVLSECEAEVMAASTAEEALRCIEQAKPHVLVSDIGMPDVDGYELLRRVRALGYSSGGRLPAIALTAFARPEDRTRALRAGYLAHISKPVDLSELVATVASVVGRIGETTTE
jgi:PAS domain S-box-containing protein